MTAHSYITHNKFIKEVTVATEMNLSFKYYSRPNCVSINLTDLHLPFLIVNKQSLREIKSLNIKLYKFSNVG